jgi:CRP-like cAMP-binding protein
MTTLSGPELDAMRQALRRISPLSDDDIAPLLAHTTLQSMDKGEALLQAGQPALLTGLVLRGGLREYYLLEDGTERTKGFNMPGEFAGSLSDLLGRQPSRVWITAEAPSMLALTPWAAYEALTHRSPAWMQFARRMAEGLYLLKTEREFELLTMDAAQRLARTLARWPALASVYSQKDIASYVGVTPVHLSRLRTSGTSAKA